VAQNLSLLLVFCLPALIIIENHLLVKSNEMIVHNAQKQTDRAAAPNELKYNYFRMRTAMS